MLADGEFRPGDEAGEGWFLGLEDIAVLGLHLGQSSPALPFPADVLTFVVTDRTVLRRHFTGRVLDAAGRAEKRRHGSTLMISAACWADSGFLSCFSRPREFSGTGCAGPAAS